MKNFFRSLALITFGAIIGAGIMAEFQTRSIRAMQDEAREALFQTKRSLAYAERLAKEAHQDAKRAAGWRYQAELWAREIKAGK